MLLDDTDTGREVVECLTKSKGERGKRRVRLVKILWNEKKQYETIKARREGDDRNMGKMQILK